MKLFRFGAPGAERPGVAAGRRRARRRVGVRLRLGRAVLRRRRADRGSRGWVAAEGARRAARPGRARASAPAVARPSKLVCIGLNYRDHARESGAALPTEPIVFLKATSALAGPDDDLRCRVGGDKTDWEVELALVIGARAKYVGRRARRWTHVAGFVLHNDYSERGFQLERHGQWTKGKSADGFAPLGPLPGHARRAARGFAGGAAVAEGQRRAQAGRQHRRHDLRRADAGQLRVAVHDAAARRRHQHRHAGRRRARAQTAALPARRRRRRIRHRRAGQTGKDSAS